MILLPFLKRQSSPRIIFSFSSLLHLPFIKFELNHEATLNATSWLPLKYTPFNLLILDRNKGTPLPTKLLSLKYKNYKTFKPFTVYRILPEKLLELKSSFNRFSKPLLVNSPNPIEILPETLVAVIINQHKLIVMLPMITQRTKKGWVVNKYKLFKTQHKQGKVEL